MSFREAHPTSQSWLSSHESRRFRPAGPAWSVLSSYLNSLNSKLMAVFRIIFHTSGVRTLEPTRINMFAIHSPFTFTPKYAREKRNIIIRGRKGKRILFRYEIANMQPKTHTMELNANFFRYTRRKKKHIDLYVVITGTKWVDDDES